MTVTAPPPIRYGGVVAGQEEIGAVTAVLSGQGWASGQVTRQFEEAAALEQGRKHALFVNSGSSALLLALALLPPGTRVAMPAVQFPTLYSAALWCGHVPALVDADDTLNMDPAGLEAVAGQVSAAVFVHMAGNPANGDRVRWLCRLRGLTLIEDICEAFGAAVTRDLRAGNLGLVSATSTHAAHHIATGEGGLVFTDDDAAYTRMRSLRDWGRSADESHLPGYYRGYVFSEPGLNLHASDIQAALGLVQLGRLRRFTEQRNANYAALAAATENLPVTRPRTDGNSAPSWYTFPFLTGRRDDLMAHLAERGIESRPIVCGNMARQPVTRGQWDPAAFPAADDVFRRGLWVSVHPSLTAGDVGRVTAALEEFFA
jgi:CDP-4-dehydro-6-deoxyglucose reductase, E1